MQQLGLIDQNGNFVHVDQQPTLDNPDESESRALFQGYNILTRKELNDFEDLFKKLFITTLKARFSFHSGLFLRGVSG